MTNEEMREELGELYSRLHSTETEGDLNEVYSYLDSLQKENQKLQENNNKLNELLGRSITLPLSLVNSFKEDVENLYGDKTDGE